jgi:hypothetical protein
VNAYTAFPREIGSIRLAGLQVYDLNLASERLCRPGSFDVLPEDRQDGRGKVKLYHLNLSCSAPCQDKRSSKTKKKQKKPRKEKDKYIYFGILGKQPK